MTTFVCFVNHILICMEGRVKLNKAQSAVWIAFNLESKACRSK